MKTLNLITRITIFAALAFAVIQADVGATVTVQEDQVQEEAVPADTVVPDPDTSAIEESAGENHADEIATTTEETDISMPEAGINATSTDNTTSPDNATSTANATSTEQAEDELPLVEIEAENATSTEQGTSTDQQEINAEEEVDASPDTVIVTGDSKSQAIVANVVNVNLFGSEALVAFLSRFSEDNAGHIDLSELSFGHDGNLGCEDCEISTTSLETLSISTGGDADIENGIIVRSSSGSNTAAAGGDSSALISTGDSYADAAVMNFANSTLVDSRYLMLFLSNYGSLDGDVVLPNSTFFEKFMSGRSQSAHSGMSSSSTDISVGNSAEVINDISTQSDTGNNLVTSTDGTVMVSTGDSYWGTTVINDINQTYIGGSSVAIIFRIYGDWSGKAFNVPPGFYVSNTGNGMEIRNVDLDLEDHDIEDLAMRGGSISISGDNRTRIRNEVDVSADTGSNEAESEGGMAAVVTGDAYANASVVNTANVTSIGRNWIGAIINIFGDWKGNVSFGQPNLWVGTSASFDNGSGPGAEVTFTYTVMNKGDAPAGGVSVKHEFGSEYAVLQDDHPVIGTVEPGSTVELTRKARIADSLPYGDTAISSTVTAVLDETDADQSDNSDIISIVARRKAPGGGGQTGVSQHPPKFRIEKTNSATSTLRASSTVSFEIVIKNEGGKAPDAVLVDEMIDESGTVMNREAWDLGEVFEDETITVSYDVSFGSSTAPGKYTNSAGIISKNRQFMRSDIAVSYVIIEESYVEQDVEVEAIETEGEIHDGGGSATAVRPRFSLGEVHGPGIPLHPSFFEQLKNGRSSTTATASVSGGGPSGGPDDSQHVIRGLLAASGNIDMSKVAGNWVMSLFLLLGLAWVGYSSAYRKIL